MAGFIRFPLTKALHEWFAPPVETDGLNWSLCTALLFIAAMGIWLPPLTAAYLLATTSDLLTLIPRYLKHRSAG